MRTVLFLLLTAACAGHQPRPCSDGAPQSFAVLLVDSTSGFAQAIASACPAPMWPEAAESLDEDRTAVAVSCVCP